MILWNLILQRKKNSWKSSVARRQKKYCTFLKSICRNHLHLERIEKFIVPNWVRWLIKMFINQNEFTRNCLVQRREQDKPNTNRNDTQNVSIVRINYLYAALMFQTLNKLIRMNRVQIEASSWITSLKALIENECDAQTTI